MIGTMGRPAYQAPLIFSRTSYVALIASVDLERAGELMAGLLAALLCDSSSPCTHAARVDCPWWAETAATPPQSTGQKWPRTGLLWGSSGGALGEPSGAWPRLNVGAARPGFR